jgi:hypothetical protein
MLGAAIGSAGAYWRWRGGERERLAEIALERGGQQDLAVIRRPSALTDDEMTLCKRYIRWPGAPGDARGAAYVLVCAGVTGDELGSAFGVSEDVLHEWTVAPTRFEITSLGHEIMSLRLDEGGRVYEARVGDAVIRAVVDESPDGVVRFIQPGAR